MGLEALDAVREGVSSRAWQRASFDPVEDRRVLAFDPSLRSTGWALMQAEYPYVIETGLIATEAMSGEEGNLSRGVEIFHRVFDLIVSHKGVIVAHEAPPATSMVYRPDSAKTGSLAIRCAASLAGASVDMRYDHAAKHRLLGRTQGVRKADIKVGLKEMWPHLPVSGMRWNEHIRDAVLVGILAMEGR